MLAPIKTEIKKLFKNEVCINKEFKNKTPTPIKAVAKAAFMVVFIKNLNLTSFLIIHKRYAVTNSSVISVVHAAPI